MREKRLIIERRCLTLKTLSKLILKRINQKSAEQKDEMEDNKIISPRTHRRSSASRELYKKKRSSSKRTFTTIVDTLTYGTLSRKKRSQSCERDENEPTRSTKSEKRPDSGYAEGNSLLFAAKRRFSDQNSPISKELKTSLENLAQNLVIESDDDEAVPSEEDIDKEEKRREKYRQDAQFKLKELVSTETTYVEKNLKEVVEGYLEYLEDTKKNPEGKVKIPSDLLEGKDRIIFGNIRDIYDFHKRCIYPEIQKAPDDPKLLRRLFESKKNQFKQKYGRYCLNKPKSEYIISKHNNKYFAVVKFKCGFNQSLSPQMMTPVQRVTRYQLLLSELERCYRLSGDSELADEIKHTYEIAHEIVDYANDMMTVGRISGFNEDVTGQGLLLKRGSVICYKRRQGMKRPKMKQCQLFVFQEAIIICHDDLSVPASGSLPQNLEYFCSFKMNKLTVREICKGDSRSAFELERKDNADGSSTVSKAHSSPGTPVVVVQCETEQERNEWLRTIITQIKELNDFAKKLQNPMFGFTRGAC